MRELSERELDAVGGGYWTPPPKSADETGEGTTPWPTKPDNSLP